MSREFSSEELDAMLADLAAMRIQPSAVMADPDWKPTDDVGFAYSVIVTLDEGDTADNFRRGFVYTSPDASYRDAVRARALSRVMAAAPDLAAFARKLLVERDRYAAMLGDAPAMTAEIMRSATVTMERDIAALRSENEELKTKLSLVSRVLTRADVPSFAMEPGRDGLQDIAIDKRTEQLVAERNALRATVERPRPVLVWRYDAAHGEHRLGLRDIEEALGDAFVDGAGRGIWSWRDGDDVPADNLRAALTAFRDAAIAAGFDVPEVPDVG